MSNGFSNDKKIKVEIDTDEVSKLLKTYKKLKRYQKSSIFTVKTMDGNEEIISSLLEEYGEED
jgi:hypothetical protein